MIEISGLSKVYDRFAAVSDLSFAVAPGQVLGLVGPNGAGKTTTLRCIAGIIPPTHGIIRIAGHDLLEDPMGAKQELAFFADEPRLFEHLTVTQHLEFMARVYQVRDSSERARALLESLELTDKASALPGDLSRGMKQKVALACGFLHAPKVMLFDEPLTGLDPLAIRTTKELIRQQAREGVSLVISSHLLHLLEEVCTHVLILKRGKAEAYGSLEGIRMEFRNRAGLDNLEEIFIHIAGDDAGK